MSLLLDSISFGLTVSLMALGLVGIVVPLLPGVLLLWLAVLMFVVFNGFEAITPGTFLFLTLIALVAGTSDYWMTMLGARRGGASRRSIWFGVVGALIGTIVLPLLGTIVGYAAGVLLSEYQSRRDWRLALKASLGGLAGWGVATAIQLGSGLLMIAIFTYQVLTG